MRREIVKLYLSVIARSEATKQSSFPHSLRDGLLRFARNDVERFHATRWLAMTVSKPRCLKSEYLRRLRSSQRQQRADARTSTPPSSPIAHADARNRGRPNPAPPRRSPLSPPRAGLTPPP